MDVCNKGLEKAPKKPECKVNKLINNIWYNSLSTLLFSSLQFVDLRKAGSMRSLSSLEMFHHPIPGLNL